MDNIIDQIMQKVDLVEQELVNPYQTLKDLNDLIKILNDAKGQVLDVALSDADQRSEKSFQVDGLLIERKSGRKIYDFKSIPQWMSANEKLKAIESQCKGAYQMYEKGGILVDEETGEQVPLPGVKHTKDTLIVKEAK